MRMENEPNASADGSVIDMPRDASIVEGDDLENQYQELSARQGTTCSIPNPHSISGHATQQGP